MLLLMLLLLLTWKAGGCGVICGWGVVGVGVGAFLGAPAPNPAKALVIRLAVLGFGVEEVMVTTAVVDGVVAPAAAEDTATSCLVPLADSIDI